MHSARTFIRREITHEIMGCCKTLETSPANLSQIQAFGGKSRSFVIVYGQQKIHSEAASYLIRKVDTFLHSHTLNWDQGDYVYGP
jgi:hypothetical protein